MAEPTRLWHPFAAMGKVDGHEFVLTRGEGCRVWDADGNEYLDATAGLWFANVGHGRAEIADAVATSFARWPPTTSSVTMPTSPRWSSRAPRRARARPRRRRLLRLRRRRGDRYSCEDRPSLLGARRATAADGDRLAPLRLSRHERLRHLALRDPGRARRLRPAGRRRRRGRPRRSRRARACRSTSSTAASPPSSASR